MSQKRPYSPVTLLMDTVNSITSSTNKWANFLTNSAQMYKYRFADKVLIYAQRPHATACAEYDQWRTQFNRYIRRNANGIMLIDNRAAKEDVRFVFDVKDTGSMDRVPLYIWSIRKDYETPVLERLLSDRGIDLTSEGGFIETMRAISYSEASKAIDQVFTYMENTDIDKEALQNAFYESVAWTVLSRCGINTSEFIHHDAFEPILLLKDFAQIHAFGSLVSRSSGEILRSVERTVKSLDGDRAAKQAQQNLFNSISTDMLKGENINEQYTELEPGDGTGVQDRSGERTSLSETGGRLSAGHGFGQGSDTDRHVRENAERISEKDRPDRVGSDDSNRRTVSLPSGNRSESWGADGSIDRADGQGRGRERGAEGERPDGMGWPDEQHQVSSRGNHPERTDLRITDEPPVYGGFFDASVLAGAGIPLSLFDAILRDGSNSKNGKLRITAAFQKGKSIEENATFLKKEYRDGGKGFTFNDRNISAWFHADGMMLANGRTALNSRNAVALSWENVATRINDLLEDGTYLAQDEMDVVESNELTDIAHQICYLRGDCNVNLTSNDEELFYGGYPDKTERISKLLAQKEKRTELIKAVQDLNAAYEHDRNIMRFHYHQPSQILQRLIDLNLERKGFTVREYDNISFSAFITEDEIDASFMGGSSFSQGKFRIYSHFLQAHTPKERIDFIKKEYGHGGKSHAVSHADNSWEDHSPTEGIILRKGEASVKFSWNQAVDRIRKLIISGKYMSQSEIEYLPQYEKEELARRVRSFFMNEPLASEIPYLSLDYYEGCKEVLKQLDDPQRVDAIIGMMKPVIEGNQPEHRLFHYRQAIYQDAINFKNGTFTLFPRQLNGPFTVPEFLGQEPTPTSQVSLFDVQLPLAGQTQYAGIDFPVDDVDEFYDEFDDTDEPIEDNLEEAADPPAAPIAAPAPKQVKANYRITDDSIGGPKEKYARNIVAIKLLKDLESAHRNPTPEEQEILSRYVGWGGLSQAFDETNKKWAKEYIELQELLSGSEYEMARASTLSAFYTPAAVIKPMFKALENFGFRKGSIIDPGCGTGKFFGLLPGNMQGSKLYGVELDSITGRIAKQLYPDANIQIKGYEETSFDDNSFHVAIGNVPFGDYQVADRRYAKNGFAIHDYFFAKTIDKVRPGGLIAFITSKGTLDKQNPSFRKYLAERAELLGAIRLPNNTFKANAGTEVTSDILFLRKREKSMVVDEPWVHLGKTVDGIPVNSYYVEHPEMVLGKMQYDIGMYGSETVCAPFENADLSMQLEEAIQNIQADYSEIHLKNQQEAQDCIPADPDVRNYCFTLRDGILYFREGAFMYKRELPMATQERVKGMIAIRDCTRELIELQTEDYSDSKIADQQKELNKLYDRFTKAYGLLNDRGNRTAFKDDSSYPLLCSLEELNEDGTLNCKAKMFSMRTIRKQVKITHVGTASEALAVSISEKARVDPDFMAQLSGLSREQLESDLKGVIFHDFGSIDPNQIPTDSFDVSSFPAVTADEYLSGNVREKLKLVNHLAEVVPADQAEKLTDYISALEAIQPEDLGPADIDVRLGAIWVPSEDVKCFVMELLDVPRMYSRDVETKFHSYDGSWIVKGHGLLERQCIKATTTYGTKRASALDIIDATLNMRQVRVFDTKFIDGKEVSIINPKETAIAQQKQQEIKDAFVEWIWRDPTRRERMVRLYNERFNSIRPREFDGSHLTFPGMNPEYALNKHQKDAVARGLYGGNTLLAHCVGAGKTFEMVALAMESKRLGLANKSMLVAINNTVGDIAADALRLYPAANILVASEDDFTPHNRRKFCSRIATGDYDLVIIAHSQFEKVPLSPERLKETIERELRDISFAIASLDKSEKQSVKQLERSRKAAEAKLKNINDQSRKDDVIYFEELGVDKLFVDEADNFKNLFFFTKMRNVAGIPQTDAKKSSDLFAKCQYLDELTNSKGIVFATGTPISNSMAEMYTMQRYLQYRTLERLGLQHFDSWASTFGETVTAMELAPEGTGFRMKTRFANFYNIPELLSIFKEVADIKTADMLDLIRPKMHLRNIAVPPSDHQKAMVLSLAERAEAVRKRLVDPSQDNMLKITNDGRKLALDQRLNDHTLPDDPNSKVNACVKDVFEIWSATKDKKSAQLIFCDLSTPKNDGTFNVYSDIRDKLISMGIPEEEIAFVHDADSTSKKKKLFSRVRSGFVRVLMGSTSKMGAGTNVQDKLIASHDLDCPWRPRDLEQRGGRIERRGNENPEAYIYRYVTEGTFDAYLYQILENKQKFISQIMTSKSPARRIQDIDEATLTYAEVKALATGDPRIMEKMNLDMEVGKLRLVKANFQNQRYDLETKVLKSYPNQLQALQARLEGLEHDTAAIKDWMQNNPKYDGNFFGMIVCGKNHIKKSDAGEALLKAVEGYLEPKKSYSVGSYMGLKLFATDNFGKEFNLQGSLSHTVKIGDDAIGNITRLNNLINGMPEQLQNTKIEIENVQKQMALAKQELEMPFKYEDELTEKQLRLMQLNIELSVDVQITDAEPELEEPDQEGKPHIKEHDDPER